MKSVRVDTLKNNNNIEYPKIISPKQLETPTFAKTNSYEINDYIGIDL